ncbi:hypothetical protein C2845_PM17G03980 [Panicum miliaceum]|uniref:Late embryogenesis abundant protein LEA-2 subgroup domain-containing protein n=1 Tax=Panicum miliaceum TaxID=4540 RepID=A0A3L6Q0V4_PANMI|nr:hypothetical protein C2845_PM17G03980 [Panicum miliaceum]
MSACRGVLRVPRQRQQPVEDGPGPLLPRPTRQTGGRPTLPGARAAGVAGSSSPSLPPAPGASACQDSWRRAISCAAPPDPAWKVAPLEPGLGGSLSHWTTGPSDPPRDVHVAPLRVRGQPIRSQGPTHAAARQERLGKGPTLSRAHTAGSVVAERARAWPPDTSWRGVTCWLWLRTLPNSNYAPASAPARPLPPPYLATLFLLALAGFLLWPADPDIFPARLYLAHVSVAARPAITVTIAVTISAALKVRVRNPDLFALYYSRLDVDIGYRGKQLGRVTYSGAYLGPRCVVRRRRPAVRRDTRRRGSDLPARGPCAGSVPFDAVVEVEGHLHLFFLSVPVKVPAAGTLSADCFGYIICRSRLLD